jgi:hypothetical protein
MTNWPIVSACHAGRLGDHRTPVGSVKLLSAPFPAGPMRRSRMRPLDPLVSSYLPEPRCQQVLPVDSGFDPFDSVGEPTLEASQPCTGYIGYPF